MADEASLDVAPARSNAEVLRAFDRQYGPFLEFYELLRSRWVNMPLFLRRNLRYRPPSRDMLLSRPSRLRSRRGTVDIDGLLERAVASDRQKARASYLCVRIVSTSLWTYPDERMAAKSVQSFFASSNALDAVQISPVDLEFAIAVSGEVHEAHSANCMISQHQESARPGVSMPMLLFNTNTCQDERNLDTLSLRIRLAHGELQGEAVLPLFDKGTQALLDSGRYCALLRSRSMPVAVARFDLAWRDSASVDPAAVLPQAPDVEQATSVTLARARAIMHRQRAGDMVHVLSTPIEEQTRDALPSTSSGGATSAARMSSPSTSARDAAAETSGSLGSRSNRKSRAATPLRVLAKRARVAAGLVLARVIIEFGRSEPVAFLELQLGSWRCPWCRDTYWSQRGLLNHFTCTHDAFEYRVVHEKRNIVFYVSLARASTSSTAEPGEDDRAIPGPVERIFADADANEYDEDNVHGFMRSDLHDASARAAALGDCVHRQRASRFTPGGASSGRAGGSPAAQRLFNRGGSAANADDSPNSSPAEARSRQYFHSLTLLPITESEEEIDSADEDDSAGLLRRSEQLLDEFEDVTETEKRFMKLWNRFMLPRREEAVC